MTTIRRDDRARLTSTPGVCCLTGWIDANYFTLTVARERSWLANCVSRPTWELRSYLYRVYGGHKKVPSSWKFFPLFFVLQVSLHSIPNSTVCNVLMIWAKSSLNALLNVRDCPFFSASQCCNTQQQLFRVFQEPFRHCSCILMKKHRLVFARLHFLGPLSSWCPQSK